MSDVSPERQRQIDELLGAAISDPDPERQVLACDDCGTPALAAYDRMLTMAHDATCPSLLAMSLDERVQKDEDSGVLVVHVAAGGQA